MVVTLTEQLGAASAKHTYKVQVQKPCITLPFTHFHTAFTLNSHYDLYAFMIICIWYMCSSNACIAWTDTSVSTAPSLHNYTQLEFTPRQYIGRLHCVQFERSILQNHWSLKLSSTGFLMVEKNWQASLCQQALEHEAIRLCFKHERLSSIFVRHLKMYIKEFVRARAVLKAAALNTIFQLRV